MLLGIDIGTSSCKFSLLDENSGRALSGSKHSYEVDFKPDGSSQVDMETLWACILDCLAELKTNYPREAAAVSAVGISVYFPTTLPLDSTGKPLRPAILYNDLRSASQVERLNAQHGEKYLQSLTGIRLSSGSTILPELLWIKENEPQLFEKTASFTMVGSYVAMKLGAENMLDSSQASLSFLTKADSPEKWAPELVELAGISQDQLPPIRPAGTPVGHISDKIAQLSGLPSGIPIVCASGDCALAALASGLSTPGQSFVCMGTTTNIVFSAEKSSGNPQYCNVKHVLPGLWLVIAVMNTGCSSAKWFCEKLFHCSMDEMMQWAQEAPEGSNGVQFHPYLQGERTPYWDPNLRASFTGLGLSTGRNEAARAVLEGVALSWKQLLTMLEADCGHKTEAVICAGGSSANAFWNQMKADCLGRPIRILNHTEISSLGACMMAGLGTGVFSSTGDALQATANLRQFKDFLPRNHH